MEGCLLACLDADKGEGGSLAGLSGNDIEGDNENSPPMELKFKLHTSRTYSCESVCFFFIAETSWLGFLKVMFGSREVAGAGAYKT